MSSRYGRWRKVLTGCCLSAALVLSPLCAVDSLAAETQDSDAPYDYQITFYAGNQGTFQAAPSISVLGADGVRKEAQIEAGADAVIVKNLAAGDRVVFDSVQGDAVTLEEGSVYYVRGLRRSGGDNDDEKPSSFQVERDQDYVVAYGVRGEQVSYVIRYEDSSGQTLAESRTYYGNVGDRPVIAFLYIEGYEPQAYNLTKTLSKNEAENVFTFVYSRVQTREESNGEGSDEDHSGGTAAGSASGTDEGSGTDTQTGGQTAPTGTGTAGAGTTGTGGAGAAGGTAQTDGVEPEGNAGTEEDGDAQAGAEVPDGEVPAEEEPRDLLNLDDEETPLSESPIDAKTAEAGAMYGLPVLAFVSLLLAAVLAVYAGYRYRTHHRKRDEEENQ